MKDLLRVFGLTDKEATVYLALLPLGPALVQDIAKHAGTYRTYTYEILTALKDRGMVSYAIRSGKQYFEAAPPEKLLQILREREAEITHILPALKELYRSGTEKPRTEVYEGKEGLKTILEDILRTRHEVLVYGATRRQLLLLQAAFPEFIRQRVQAKISTRVITERSAQALDMHTRDRAELRRMRFLPAHTEFPTVTNIYANKVAILSLGKHHVGVIIENEEVAATQRMVFELLWNTARP